MITSSVSILKVSHQHWKKRTPGLGLVRNVEVSENDEVNSGQVTWTVKAWAPMVNAWTLERPDL